jgi:hypothetical protein
MNLRALMTCVLFACVVPATASDRWEATIFNLTDDSSATPNVLRHGLPQIGHDLEGDPDEDWMMVRVKANHSYEARVSSATLYWGAGCGNPECPRFDRVSAAGDVLTAGIVSSDDVGGIEIGPIGGGTIVASGQSVRWTAELDGKAFLRARGDMAGPLPASLTYDVEFYDTTYFVPRFNNSASQVTSFIVQNTTNQTVSGEILFYSTSGTLLQIHVFQVAESAVLVLNTAGLAGVTGQSGSARILHNGGYGALAGKAVALEPATGFTFDTPFVPVPR